MSYILLFISVLSGFLLAYLLRKKELKHIEVFMAFSGGFLLAITVFELLPPVFLELNKSAGIYIMIGILLQIFLEFLSKGAEHGHIHIHKDRKYFPWMLFLSLCIHAFIEGMPISDKNNLLWAIIIHKIPVATILSFFFISSGYTIKKTVIFITIFALMSPLGNFIAQNFEFLAAYENELNALVIGIFLHVSTTILFESSKNHQFDAKKMIAVIVAVLIAYFL